jgi:hypothetical protein
MKKIIQIISILLYTATLSTAQPGNGQGMARIHAAKMAYIADRLHLTSYQASDFTPLYNDYEREVRGTRQSFFSKYKGTRPDEANDATSRQWIDDNLDYQQQIIELKRKYNDRFLKVISPQQLSDLYKAEREFNQMLMQRLRQQRNGGRFNRMNR